MQDSLLKNIKATFWCYRGRFLKGLAMVIIANGLLILNPLIFRQALMALDPSTKESVGLLGNFLHTIFGSYTSTITLWAILLLCITTISAFFKYFMRVAFISISRDAERQVRSSLYARIQEQSMSFYDRHGVGELLSRLTNDITTYRDVLGPGIMYPMFFLTLVIPGFFALFSISSQLASISLIPLVAIPLLNFFTRKQIYALSRVTQKGLADLSNLAQEHYSGIRIVKGYVVESSLMKRFAALSRSLINVNIKLNCFQGLLYPFFTLLTKIITIALVVLSAFIILKSWSTLSSADFISFMWIQSYIFFPILMLAWVLPIYSRGRAAYDRLFEIYKEPIEVKNPPSQLAIPQLADIEFHNLTFQYPAAEKPAIKNLSLHITGGSFIGITGAVGAGKTTLFRLLNREYEVPAGSISIGGQDIHAYPLEAFWKEIVTVEQIPFLFSRSIADNVRFGNERALQADIETVSAYADLHETVLDFPDQYETLVGERGITLSGGQKQRVAMARAFLVNRSILLLDDVFAAMDTETEFRIFQAIRNNIKDKTIILITHRTSILESMDRVLYMQDGQIVEDGPPASLKKANGHYAALAALQNLRNPHAR